MTDLWGAPRRVDSLHDYVVERMRDMIVEGSLEHGVPIDEMAVATQLGVSRGPVREALKVLRAEGLVEIWPRRGAHVVQLTPKRIRDLYEVLISVEMLAIRLACANASDAEIVELADLHEAMRSQFERRNLRLYSALNQQIHERIVAISDNSVLAEVYGGIAARARMARFGVTMTGKRWEQAMAEHEEITSALRQRDADRAAELMQAHLEAVSDILCRQLDA